MARPTGTAYEPCPHSSPLPSAYEQSAKELKVPLPEYRSWTST